MSKITVLVFAISVAISSATSEYSFIQANDKKEDKCTECLPFVIRSVLSVKGLSGNGALNQQLIKRIRSLEIKAGKLLKEIVEIKSKCCKPPPPKVFSSCEAIKAAKPNSPSGNYKLTIKGKVVTVYCNMKPLFPGDKGGWIRVSSLDMKDPKQKCPTGFKLYTQNGVRACGKHNAGCQSLKFPSVGFSYTEVSGRVYAYQKGSIDGLYDGVRLNLRTIDKPYIDGISITRGSPRKHIWSFIASQQESLRNQFGCPCASNAQGIKPPAFVGNDYFCEAGVLSGQPNVNTLYTNDLLWDGKKCNSVESPCCSFRNVPWFKKTISPPTQDQIELRICTNYHTSNEDAPFTLYEIYVK